MLRNKIERGKLLVKQQGVMRTAAYYIGKKAREKAFLEEVRKYHIYPEELLEQQRQKTFPFNPCISIVTPLYNTPQDFLEELLISVQKQTYPNWELCLADGSDDEHENVRECCEKYAKQDSRIKYKKLENNEGIVGNTNQCLKFVTGDYIGLLDHDDLLHPSALYEVVQEIQKGADFIYTDEMKFKDNIQDSTDIVCKSGFGKDELRSHNYICHFVVFQKELLSGMTQLYRQECEGSQDYDMVLRLTEKARKIVHIPKMLYYWRVHQGSVSMDLSVKQYAVDAAKRAIQDHLVRENERGNISSNLPYQTIYRIKYDLKETPLVTVVLWGERTGKELYLHIREVLKKTRYQKVEIVTSCDLNGVNMDDENVKIVSVKKENGESIYSWFNRVYDKTHGKYLLYFNDQCIPETENWIEELLMFAQRKDVCAVSPQINYKNQKIYFAGAVLDKDEECGIHVLNYNRYQNEEGYEANLKHVKNTTLVSAFCMMVSREQMQKLSGYNLDMQDYGDADLCLRGREQGEWNVWTCFAQIKYNGKEDIYLHWKNDGEFRKKWKDKFSVQDEYYHPFLKQLRKI